VVLGVGGIVAFGLAAGEPVVNDPVAVLVVTAGPESMRR
jgi:hypothetical protein